MDNQTASTTISESTEDLTTEEKKSLLMEIISSFQLNEEKTNTVLPV